METLIFILAIIGVAWILRLLSKAFKKLGNALDKIGDAIADRSVSTIHTNHNSSEKDKDIREKIRTLQGNGTDKEYKKFVQKEIDDLIEGVEDK